MLAPIRNLWCSTIATRFLHRVIKYVSGVDDVQSCCRQITEDKRTIDGSPSEPEQTSPSSPHVSSSVHSNALSSNKVPHHNRSASWPMASFMQPSEWEGYLFHSPDPPGSKSRDEITEDDGETMHSLDLKSAPHEWDAAFEHGGTVMSFLVDSRTHTAVTPCGSEADNSLVRSQSCPSLSRRSASFSKNMDL